MLTTPATYKAKNDRAYRKPLYFVVLDGLATRYSTGSIESPSATYKRYMSIPSGTGGDVQVHRGKSSIEDADFELLDVGGAITTLVHDNAMLNRKATIYAGFEGIPEADYIPIFTGFISALRASGSAYDFSLSAILYIQKQNIFTVLAQGELLLPLAQNLKTQMTLVDASAFPTSGFVMIAKELIQYSGKSGNVLTGLTRGVGGFGDGDIAHSAGAKLKQAVKLEGNPIDLALQILTSTGTATNGAYDVLPANQGLGIDVADVDVARFEEERDKWLAGMSYRFYISESVEAKKFLEEQIFAMVNAYPTVLGSGKISIRIFASPLPIDGGEELTDDFMEGLPKWNANFGDLINRVEYFFDYDPLDKEFDALVSADDTASQTSFSAVRTHKIESQGMRTELGTALRAKFAAQRILSRFAIPPVELDVTAHLSQHVIEQGDLIDVTHPKVPSPTGRGITKASFEVVSRSIDWSSGDVDLELLATQSTAAGTRKKYGAVNHNTASDYTVAKAANQTFTEAGGRVTRAIDHAYVANNSGLMSDGDEGFFIA